MLQSIIRCPSRGTKGQFAGTTSISPPSSRPSLIESMRSNCRLFSRFTRWTFRVGTTWFLHYRSDGRPSSPENHSKSLATNDFQPSHSHFMAEAPLYSKRQPTRPNWMEIDLSKVNSYVNFPAVCERSFSSNLNPAVRQSKIFLIHSPRNKLRRLLGFSSS